MVINRSKKVITMCEIVWNRMNTDIVCVCVRFHCVYCVSECNFTLFCQMAFRTQLKWQMKTEKWSRLIDLFIAKCKSFQLRFLLWQICLESSFCLFQIKKHPSHNFISNHFQKYTLQNFVIGILHIHLTFLQLSQK